MAMKKKAAPKKAAPAKKKSPIDYPEGASGRAKNAQSKRMEAQRRASYRVGQPDRGNDAAGERMSEYQRKNKGEVYSAKETEGGRFWSTGLSNKAELDYAREQAKRLKAASQQKKQGVTKSGGYSQDMWTQRSLQDLRTKSSKFKAEQAVKKSGGSMSRNARGKTTKRNAK
jgi:hypothetical protein